jgi:hypothetical protein
VLGCHIRNHSTSHVDVGDGYSDPYATGGVNADNGGGSVGAASTRGQIMVITNLRRTLAS